MNIQTALQAILPNTLTVSPHLCLERINAIHAAPLFQLVDQHRPYMQAWLPWVAHTHAVSDTLAFIDHCDMALAANTDMVFVMMYRAESGAPAQVCGCIGLHEINFSNRRASIGYWLGQTFQSRGLMTQAVAALTDMAFEQLGLHKISIHCATANRQSRAVPERLRFVMEGVLRQHERLHGGYVDLAAYSRLVSDAH